MQSMILISAVVCKLLPVKDKRNTEIKRMFLKQNLVQLAYIAV